MHQYQISLHFLKEIMLMGQIGILLIRFASQVIFTIPTLLNLLQLLLASAMHCRTNNYEEAKIYIFINFGILYILSYNTLELLAGNSFTIDFFLVQKFWNSYKYWGYSIEFVFRILSEVIAWRALQFSRYYQRFLRRI